MTASSRTFIIWVALIAFFFLLFRWFGSDRADRDAIIKLVRRGTEVASVTEDVKIFEIQGRIQKLVDLTTPEVTGEIKNSHGEGYRIESRQDLASQIGPGILMLKPFSAEARDITVDMIPGNSSASCEFDAIFSAPLNAPKKFESAHFVLQLQKTDGSWKVSKIQAEFSPPEK